MELHSLYTYQSSLCIDAFCVGLIGRLIHVTEGRTLSVGGGGWDKVNSLEGLLGFFFGRSHADEAGPAWLSVR